MYVQAEEHDIPVWARDVSDVRRPDVRVSHMPEDSRAEDFALLGSNAKTWIEKMASQLYCGQFMNSPNLA